MLSVDLDSIIYATATSSEVLEPFRSALVSNLKSCRDTARILETKIIVQVSKEKNNVEIINEAHGCKKSA